MKNIIISGFDSDPMVQVLQQLHNDKIINIKIWYYDKNMCDKAFLSSPIAQQTKKNTEIWQEKWEKTNIFPNIEINRQIVQQMDWIMQAFARDTDFFREFFYDYKNVINYVASRYFNEIKQNDIDTVLFSDIPHGPNNVLLYIVAKAMGVNTIFLVTLNYILPNKFIYSHTIEDFGNFSHLPDYHPVVPEWHIKKDFKKNLDYMTPKQIEKDRKEDWGRKLKFFHNPVQWMEERKAVINKNFAKYDSVNDFIERKTIQLITKHFRKQAYNKNMHKMAAKNVDLNRKFVYVPLHLQPELTVDTIGDIYRDQILVVEKIRNMIPDDWYIYVKENPKQLTIARDKYFFKRLSTIPNTILADRNVNTYELLENSQFLATITGTAAWESITGGKPALIFGNVWFKMFPGIIRYHDGLAVEDIVNYSFEHRDLEKAVENFSKKLYDGVWLNDDIKTIRDYDSEKNFNSLYNSLKFIFRE